MPSISVHDALIQMELQTGQEFCERSGSSSDDIPAMAISNNDAEDHKSSKGK